MRQVNVFSFQKKTGVLSEFIRYNFIVYILYKFIYTNLFCERVCSLIVIIAWLAIQYFLSLLLLGENWKNKYNRSRELASRNHFYEPLLYFLHELCL